LITGLVGCELVVRIFDLRALPPPRAEGGLLAEVKDPNHRFVNLPNARQVLHFDDGQGTIRSVHMRTNGQRFRGPEVTREKAAGVLRVACLGDSHTFGHGIEAGETWPDRLRERALAPVEVLNCGVEGYDSLQAALWFERFVEPFDPDVVLLAYFPNDVVSRGQGPAGAVPSDRLTVWTHPERGGWVRSLRDASMALDILMDRVYRSRFMLNQQSVWDRQYVEEHPGWRASRNALVRLQDRCAAADRELRVILFPFLVPEGEAFLSRDVLATVADFCRRKQIVCLDAEPALLAAMESADGNDLRVDPSDFHAGPKAHAAFAQAVAGWLAVEGMPFRAGD